jgi:hypothetical protein
MREANYNPFLGSEGRWVGDEQQGIGELDGYNEDSIAAWFKNAFAGDDMVKHRREALDTLNGWNTQVRNPNYQSNMDRSERWMDGKGHGINKGTKRMNKRYFDEMGLAEKFGLEFVDPRQEAYDEAVAGFSSGGESTGGFMDAYNSQRPVNPAGLATGGARPEALAGPQVKPGGFMESYLKKKAENKPSVMSLMTELKDA